MNFREMYLIPREIIDPLMSDGRDEMKRILCSGNNTLTLNDDAKVVIDNKGLENHKCDYPSIKDEDNSQNVIQESKVGKFEKLKGKELGDQSLIDKKERLRKMHEGSSVFEKDQPLHTKNDLLKKNSKEFNVSSRDNVKKDTALPFHKVLPIDESTVLAPQLLQMNDLTAPSSEYDDEEKKDENVEDLTRNLPSSQIKNYSSTPIRYKKSQQTTQEWKELEPHTNDDASSQRPLEVTYPKKEGWITVTPSTASSTIDLDTAKSKTSSAQKKKEQGNLKEVKRRRKKLSDDDKDFKPPKTTKTEEFVRSPVKTRRKTPSDAI